MRIGLMKRLLLVLFIAVSVQAQTDKEQLTKLLNDFLAGASVNDAAMHDRFWADDLIYTGSSGRRVSKADIMKDVRSAPPPKAGDPSVVYTAEDVRINLYGTTAVVAFKLVGTTEHNGRREVGTYLNSGTFLKRKGIWQVVNWQATILPRPEEEAKKDIAAVEALFLAALVNDPKELEAHADESFVWTRNAGDQVTRKQLIDGAVHVSAEPSADAVITVFPNAAIVRRGAYTLTLVNRGGWRVVSMQW